MAEEDQENHFDDPEEQEPIKVSVTFKLPKPELDDVKLIDSSDDQVLDDKSTSGDPQQEEPCLPVNPPVSPIPCCLDAEKFNGEGHETEQSEVLEGWKGYGNNIYIQPIIVNNASCATCHCPTDNKPQRRFTSEDLRKQMRLREANTWITKHNERIRSTGTLRTRVHYNEKQKQQAVKEPQKQITEHEDKTTPKPQRKTKSKLYKGFVCRTWAMNFLPKEVAEDEEDEFVPLFVQKYVDNSTSSFPVTKKVGSKVSEEKRNTSVLTSTQTDLEEPSAEPTATDSVFKLEIQMKEKACVDKNNNGNTGRDIKTMKDNFQSLQNISGGFVCCCGEVLTHDQKLTRSQSTLPFTKHLRHERSRSCIETRCVPLQIKQFPPINPLEGIKRPNFPARIKRGVLPARRPHTVDTAFLSKDAILVNGHHNLQNDEKPSHSFNGQYRERDATLSLENLNKEKQIYPQVKFENKWEGSKYFDKVMLLSTSIKADTRVKGRLDKNATPQCALHEEQSNQGRRGRYRSLSEPRGNAKPSRIMFDKNQNVLYGNTRNRLPLRTAPHSLNSEDNDSNTDSNDTGLGSEIEYTFDGSAKLDIYLQPRGASCH